MNIRVIIFGIIALAIMIIFDTQSVDCGKLHKLKKVGRFVHKNKGKLIGVAALAHLASKKKSKIIPLPIPLPIPIPIKISKDVHTPVFYESFGGHGGYHGGHYGGGFGGFDSYGGGDFGGYGGGYGYRR